MYMFFFIIFHIVCARELCRVATRVPHICVIECVFVCHTESSEISAHIRISSLLNIPFRLVKMSKHELMCVSLTEVCCSSSSVHWTPSRCMSVREWDSCMVSLRKRFGGTETGIYDLQYDLCTRIRMSAIDMHAIQNATNDKVSSCLYIHAFIWMVVLVDEQLSNFQHTGTHTMCITRTPTGVYLCAFKAHFRFHFNVSKWTEIRLVTVCLVGPHQLSEKYHQK